MLQWGYEIIIIVGYDEEHYEEIAQKKNINNNGNGKPVKEPTDRNIKKGSRENRSLKRGKNMQMEERKRKPANTRKKK